jgi:hypothetical protein
MPTDTWIQTLNPRIRRQVFYYLYNCYACHVLISAIFSWGQAVARFRHLISGSIVKFFTNCATTVGYHVFVSVIYNWCQAMAAFVPLICVVDCPMNWAATAGSFIFSPVFAPGAD